jgi:hypothetical protein
MRKIDEGKNGESYQDFRVSFEGGGKDFKGVRVLGGGIGRTGIRLEGPSWIKEKTRFDATKVIKLTKIKDQSTTKVKHNWGLSLIIFGL